MGLRGLELPSAKEYWLGTHRLVQPESTVERIHPHLTELGITRVANITGLDRIGIPVVTVCRPNSRSLAVSQGKGLTLAAARASGLMEAVEAHHAEHISSPLERASYRQMRRTHRVVDVSRLAPDPQSRFDRDLSLLWIEGFDLVGECPTWLPLESVHLDLRVAQPEGAGCFAVSSKGLASGNHVCEAISHAICELVEQDAFRRWTSANLSARCRMRLDLASLADEQLVSIVEQFHRAGVDAAVWEITSEVGLPAFFCTIVEGSGEASRWLHSASGFGCHPTREIAVMRALVEAAQSRLTAISGSRDDLTRANYRHHLDPAFLATQRRSIDHHQPVRTLAQAPTRLFRTFAEDIAWELLCLRRVGLEQVVVVDLSREEFGLPVVKVVVPGLVTSPGAGKGSSVPRGMRIIQREQQ